MFVKRYCRRRVAQTEPSGYSNRESVFESDIWPGYEALDTLQTDKSYEHVGSLRRRPCQSVGYRRIVYRWFAVVALRSGDFSNLREMDSTWHVRCLHLILQSRVSSA